MTQPGFRPATPEEAAEDKLKRSEALEDAMDRGLYSPREYDEAVRKLNEFTGYDRPVHVVPPDVQEVIDAALAEHGYSDPKTNSTESLFARDVALTALNMYRSARRG